LAQKRPNILFVFPDQLSARWMGCYGHSIVQTPYIDRFAEESYLFTRAFTNCPLCTPYRASLLTGRYPHETGIFDNGKQLPDNEKTLAEYLDEVGYHTYYFGKWHLSGDPQGNRWVPPEKRGGFQHFTGWESHHVDHYKGTVWGDDPQQPIYLKGHETDGLTSLVCDTLRNEMKEPFCFFVSYQAPHAPSSPKDQHRLLYANKDLCPEPNTDTSAWFRAKGWNADYGIQEFRERYYGEITHIDEAFGEILTTLKDTGFDQNTVVIFTSDHGDMNGCHGHFGKGRMYQEAVHIPLVIRMPGQHQQKIVDYPVMTVDFMPTLLDLANTSCSAGTHGKNITPYLQTGVFPKEERSIYIEYQNCCVIKGRYKLVASHIPIHPITLFDLNADPDEMHNLIDEPNQNETIANLIDELNEWYTTTNNGISIDKNRGWTRYEQ